MDNETFHIKGSSIRSKLDFAQDRFGEEAVERLQAKLSEQVPVGQVLDSSWYPFSVYDRLLRDLAAEWFDGDLDRLQEVGGYSAKKALTSAYEVYAREKDFHRFLERLALLHDRFYSNSRLWVKSKGENFCEVDIIGVPDGFEAAAQVAAGFYVGAARLMGHSEAQCEFHQEGDRVRYRLEW